MGRAFVTGAAGFVGHHVVAQLLDAGHEVRALHLPGQDLANLNALTSAQRSGLELFPGDVTDLAAMRRGVTDCDTVYHLAAIYALWLPRPETMFEVNVGGTDNVLRAAADGGASRIVHCSSIARFGGQGPHTDATEDSLFALGPTGDAYARSKAEAHVVAERWAAEGLDVTIVAPCGPIGPGDIGPTPTGRLLLTLARLPAMIAVPTTTNFIDVRDVARGHLLAAARGVAGRSYLLGAENLSVQDLSRAVADALGRRPRPLAMVPARLALGAGRLMRAASESLLRTPPLFTDHAVRIAQLGLRARCDRARDELGLRPRPVSQAVADALAWWRQRGQL